MGADYPNRLQVPAIAETLPGYSGLLWIAVYAPRGIPAAVKAQLQTAMKGKSWHAGRKI